jgi:hypothetical protein
MLCHKNKSSDDKYEGEEEGDDDPGDEVDNYGNNEGKDDTNKHRMCG